MILDLGPSSGENVAFFTGRHCTLKFEDLYTQLAGHGGLGEARRPELFARLLPFEPGTRLDVVLAWDLLNYLERSDLEHLLTHLARFSRPGTILFALLGYRAEVPERPLQYRLLDEKTLLYGASSPRTRPCPRYTPRDLSLLLPDFDLQSAFLLRHGFEELVFIRPDPEEEAEEPDAEARNGTTPLGPA